MRTATERVTPGLTKIRHDLHRHPELSNREIRTAALVARELRRLGLEVRTGVAKTGVIGVLRGAQAGPVVSPPNRRSRPAKSRRAVWNTSVVKSGQHTGVTHSSA